MPPFFVALFLAFLVRLKNVRSAAYILYVSDKQRRKNGFFSRSGGFGMVFALYYSAGDLSFCRFEITFW